MILDYPDNPSMILRAMSPSIILRTVSLSNGLSNGPGNDFYGRIVTFYGLIMTLWRKISIDFTGIISTNLEMIQKS
jgi:hypothetical protein